MLVNLFDDFGISLFEETKVLGEGGGQLKIKENWKTIGLKGG